MQIKKAVDIGQHERITVHMKKTDTVLFDFDGTIMDTNGMILGSWQHTFRTLTGSETDPDMLVRTFGEPLEKTMARFFPEVPT